MNQPISFPNSILKLLGTIRQPWMMIAVSMVLLNNGCGNQNNSNPAANLTFYGQIVLGTDPTNNSLVLDFVVRGDDIYWDRNQDFQAEEDEKINSGKVIEMSDLNQGVTYQIKELRLTRAVNLVSEGEPQRLGLTVTSDQFPGFEQLGSLSMSADPQRRDWLQFYGEQEFVFDDYQDGFLIGGEAEIRINVGTFGGENLGPAPTPDHQLGSSNPWQNQQRLTILLPSPSGPFPEVEIRFPTHGEGIIVKRTLDKAC